MQLVMFICNFVSQYTV